MTEMNIKVSHEVPIKLLDYSRNFNDYDYCLVHLLDQKPEYKRYYESCKLYDRELLLDNSIFELGKAFDSDKFAEKVVELEPTYYIIPDSLQNCEETISNWKSFVSKYNDLPGLKIGVVQGNTWRELKYCYQFMNEHADYIAISFDYMYYMITGESPTNNKLELWCSGRQRLIQQLMDSGIWNTKKPHHLLGCSLAKEFKAYVGQTSIRSVDTSNPVVAALHNLKYNGDLGLKTKPSTKLADLIDSDVSGDQKALVDYNVAAFKEILGRPSDTFLRKF